eukprot:TRINITY_DN35676_c0_g1_i1.p1 TRINITY_DN35676_c0_g1~~TRINITY_DN35676_c0_g1_i1.p1  ORF type:complete len:518 (+),score=79.97 TRINITY_DN35676_c0_g1_i1:90-1643(+)
MKAMAIEGKEWKNIQGKGEVYQRVEAVLQDVQDCMVGTRRSKNKLSSPERGRQQPRHAELAAPGPERHAASPVQARFAAQAASLQDPCEVTPQKLIWAGRPPVLPGPSSSPRREIAVSFSSPRLLPATEAAQMQTHTITSMASDAVAAALQPRIAASLSPEKPPLVVRAVPSPGRAFVHAAACASAEASPSGSPIKQPILLSPATSRVASPMAVCASPRISPRTSPVRPSVDTAATQTSPLPVARLPLSPSGTTLAASAASLRSAGAVPPGSSPTPTRLFAASASTTCQAEKAVVPVLPALPLPPLAIGSPLHLCQVRIPSSSPRSTGSMPGSRGASPAAENHRIASPIRRQVVQTSLVAHAAPVQGCAVGPYASAVLATVVGPAAASTVRVLPVSTAASPSIGGGSFVAASPRLGLQEQRPPPRAAPLATLNTTPRGGSATSASPVRAAAGQQCGGGSSPIGGLGPCPQYLPGAAPLSVLPLSARGGSPAHAVPSSTPPEQRGVGDMYVPTWLRLG